jgi:hypothetical protein
MSALSVFLERVFEKSGRKRPEKDALYPDASKAIEEFNTRLTQRIAAQRARNQAEQRRECQETLVSG